MQAIDKMARQIAFRRMLPRLRVLWEHAVNLAVLREYSQEEIHRYGGILRRPMKLATAIIEGYDFVAIDSGDHSELEIRPNFARLKASGVSADLLTAIEYGSTELSGIGAPLRGVIAQVESKGRELFGR